MLCCAVLCCRHPGQDYYQPAAGLFRSVRLERGAAPKVAVSSAEASLPSLGKMYGPSPSSPGGNSSGNGSPDGRHSPPPLASRERQTQAGRPFDSDDVSETASVLDAGEGGGERGRRRQEGRQLHDGRRGGYWQLLSLTAVSQ